MSTTVNVDLLVCGRWIIPVEPDNTVLEQHAIAVSDGVIVDLLPADQALSRYRGARVEHCTSHVLIPGLVNAHTHAAMSLFRGIANDLPLQEWLHGHIWPAEQRWVSQEFTAAGTRHAIAEMLRSGTTCFSDMYFFPDVVAEVAVATGMRAVVGLIVIDFPTPWASGPQEYFDKGEAVHDRFRHTPLIHTAFAPHAPYSVADTSLRKISILAEELDLPIHIHVHENEQEIRDSLRIHGKRPLQRLEELGLLSHRLAAVHLTQLEADEISLLVHNGVNVVHCPQSNLKLASGFSPVGELRSRGINVALGTDGAASNNDLDMIAEMQTAALLGKGVSRDPGVLPAPDVLRMATLDGARALSIDEITGSLVPGKSADIVAIDMSVPETQPLYDPIGQLIYAAGRSQVTDVWIAGRQVLQSRELLTINEAELLARTGQWQGRISAGTGQGE